jgi:signal transduction histidine kinase
MTARRRSASDDDRFANLFHAVPVPAYAWRRRDDDFVLESYNHAADAASDRRAASFVGRTARDVYADEPEILADFDRAARGDEAFSREFWYTIPDTQERYALEVTYAPISRDTLVVHTVSHTEQRMIEDELHERLDDLRAADAARRRLLDDLSRAQERERERIAEEIRDEAIEPLVAVALRLQTVERTADGEVAGNVAKLERSVTDAIARLRHLTFTLHSETLARTTLAAALRDLVDRLTGRTGPRTSLENALTREPDVATRIGAYRIAQQAIANAVRHAEANVISVALAEREGDLVVVVSDDGRGFDAGSVTAVPDGGLALMHRRARLAGGRVDVRSAPGHGTTVEIVLAAGW